jgi:hypothetical protein
MSSHITWHQTFILYQINLAISSLNTSLIDDLFFWISVNHSYYFCCQQLECDLIRRSLFLNLNRSNSCRFAVRAFLDLASHYFCKIVSQLKQTHFTHDHRKSSNSCKTASQSEHFAYDYFFWFDKSLFLQSRIAVKVEWRNEENSKLKKLSWDENQEMRNIQSHK